MRITFLPILTWLPAQHIILHARVEPQIRVMTSMRTTASINPFTMIDDRSCNDMNILSHGEGHGE